MCKYFLALSQKVTFDSNWLIRSSLFPVFLQMDLTRGRSKGDLAISSDWAALSASERASYCKKARGRPAPANSQLRADCNFGCISEGLDNMIENYVTRRWKSGEYCEAKERVCQINNASWTIHRHTSCFIICLMSVCRRQSFSNFIS